jgi:cell wall-associated NlpC family hydrolase
LLLALVLCGTTAWTGTALAAPEAAGRSAQGQAAEAQATTQAITAATATGASTDRLAQWLSQRGITAQATQAAQVAVAAPAKVARHVRDRATGLVIAAMNFLDVPYRYGGNTAESGFDCSGFTRFMFSRFIGLERAKNLRSVARQDLAPGDLVFFNTRRRAYSHVGIYVGDGKFIHAPRTGAVVRIESLRSSYWARRYNGARRADGAPASAAGAGGPATAAGG